jgi:hypothetical protein
MVEVETIRIEKWLFAILLSVIGFMFTREINRLSTSIETLVQAQKEHVVMFLDSRSQFKEQNARMEERLRFIEKRVHE